MNQKIAVGIVFVSAMFMTVMDITIVNVALPTIGRDFNISPTAVDGVVIAYLVSLAVFIPASGWLGRPFRRQARPHHRHRGLQRGLGAVWAGPEHVPAGPLPCDSGRGRRHDGTGRNGHALPGLSACRAGSGCQHPDLGRHRGPRRGTGPGGFLVTNFSWRWVFFVNVPIGIVASFSAPSPLRRPRRSMPAVSTSRASSLVAPDSAC